MNGILMRDKGGKLHQIETGLSFGEAFGMVWELRQKRDGNQYWIGKI